MRNTIYGSVLTALLIGMTTGATAAVTVTDLTCEYRENPLGLNTDQPRLSWKLNSSAKNEKQTAFELIAASSEDLLTPEKADLYSSGKVEGSDWSVLYPYLGKKPSGLGEVFWKVRVWDKNGKASAWSKTAMWTYGPKQESEWLGANWIGKSFDKRSKELKEIQTLFSKQGQWIWTDETKGGAADAGLPAGPRYFVKEITVKDNLKGAMVTMTADDSFSLCINGKEVLTGDSWKSVFFGDIKGVLKTGKNIVAVKVTNGNKGYAGLAAVLSLSYDSGSENIISDDSWKSTADAEGWNSADLDSSKWGKTVILGKYGIQPWGGSVKAANVPNLPAIMVRNDFDLPADKNIRAAYAYISGLGLFELYLNGEKVGDHVLDSMVTDYTKQVSFQTFDVKDYLQADKNAIGVLLGNGRFTNPRVGKHYGVPMTRVLLRVEYTDGTIDNITTNDRWQISTEGPIRFNNEFDGETYDARMETPGWADINYLQASRWDKANLMSEAEIPAGKVVAQEMPPIRVNEILQPKEIKQLAPGTFMVDMGQNMVGWCKLKAEGPAGTEIKLVHAETLDKEGNLYMANLRSAKVTDTYIMKGIGQETYEPRFIYHGFRFVKITGYPGILTKKDICGCVVHDDLDQIGEFETSNPLVNQIYHNVFWGVRGNYRSMPTDCPQRDERLGWMGDRASESLGESFIFNIAPLYTKWVRDMEDAQRDNGAVPGVCPNYWDVYHDDVTWPSATIITPQTLYMQYGDTRVIETHYASMKKWMDLMQTYFKDGVIARDTYGDWCCPPERPELIHSEDPLRKTAPVVLASTYFYGNLRLMEGYANILGKKEDAKVWAERAESLKAAFIKKCYNPDTKTFDNGSQTSSVLPLFFGMVPDGEKDAVFEQLVDKIMNHTKGHIGTGLVGAQYLNRVLSDNGRSDISWKLVTNDDYPSWGYMVRNGATTIWELWNGDTANPAMNSHNHVMLVGDLNVWFYERLAGIRSSAPGYKEITFKAEPVEGVDYVKASLKTPYGKAASSWKVKNGKFKWNIEVPANTTATVITPDGVTQKVGSGKYTFTVQMP